MPALTAIYLDFESRPCHLAWRWLSLLPERSVVDIRPYCLDAGTDAAGNRVGPWDQTRPAPGLELLSLGELAREAGRPVHERYVDMVFAAIHDERRDLGQPEPWFALAAEVGLNLDLYTRDGDRWRAEVGLWQREAEDELGVFAVPSVVFEEEHVMLLRLEQPVEGAQAARRLLGTLQGLVRQSMRAGRR